MSTRGWGMASAGDRSDMAPHDRLGPVKLSLFSRNYVGHKAPQIAALVLLAFGIDVAAAVGISYVAGFGAVRAAWDRFSPIWLAGVVGCIAISFVGYYYAYRELYRAKDGPGLARRDLRAVVLAGFGGFFTHGGAAMDLYALEGAGSDEYDARTRVAALAGLEHGALGLIGTVAGIAALLMGLSRPPFDFQYPWAVIPIPGMLLAFWLARRYAHRIQGKGLKERVKVLLDSIVLIRHMFGHPGDHVRGPAGMTVFWLAELGAAWFALAALGFFMNGAAFTIGYLTGAAFTRRTGPLAGAGILMLTLSVTLWYSGAPFGVAIGAIFIVRFLSFWLPMPFSVASLPTLRRIGEAKGPQAASDVSAEPTVGRGDERIAG